MRRTFWILKLSYQEIIWYFQNKAKLPQIVYIFLMIWVKIINNSNYLTEIEQNQRIFMYVHIESFWNKYYKNIIAAIILRLWIF